MLLLFKSHGTVYITKYRNYDGTDTIVINPTKPINGMNLYTLTPMAKDSLFRGDFNQLFVPFTVGDSEQLSEGDFDQLLVKSYINNSQSFIMNETWLNYIRVSLGIQ